MKSPELVSSRLGVDFFLMDLCVEGIALTIMHSDCVLCLSWAPYVYIVVLMSLVGVR